MAYKRKTWAEKMQPEMQPVVETTTKTFADIPQGSRMLIATPGIVENYLKNIPEGSETTLSQLRKDLAADYNADYTCPVTTGIFLRIVAENAWDQLQQGKKEEEVAPFWRIINLKSPTAKKLSFGTEFLIRKRKQEQLPV